MDGIGGANEAVFGLKELMHGMLVYGVVGIVMGVIHEYIGDWWRVYV